MAKEKGERKTAKTNSEIDESSENETKDTDKNCNHAPGKRVRGRKSAKPSTNAARERSRVQNLKQAFLELQKALPNVPSGTKLSKLDILLLATNYISHLMSKLSNGHLKEHLSRLKDTGTLHPIKVPISHANTLTNTTRTFIISTSIPSILLTMLLYNTTASYCSVYTYIYNVIERRSRK